MHETTSRRVAHGAAAVLMVILAACTPSLDWRELRPPGTHLAFMLPCKPTVQERPVQLAGQAVVLQLHACAAGAQTWGLAHADMADPARVGAALSELGASAAANIRGQSSAEREARVAGATPNPSSRWAELRGQQPGGRLVVMQLAVFTHGTRVYQATVLGEAVNAEAAETFFGALRVLP